MTRKAFSLVEVLIAMVIVTLITATGMFAYKMAIGEVNKKESVRYESAMHFAQIKNLFNATYFYILEKRDSFFPDKFEYFYLFDKSESRIKFVSNAPIYSKRLSLIDLKIEDEKLIYREKPIYDPNEDYKNPKFDKDTKEYVLLENIKEAKFSFEKPFDFPKDKDFSSTIPKLVILEFERDNQIYKYIFDIKYNFYKLKMFFEEYREFS